MTFGWNCRPLGSPVLVGRQRLVGLHIAIDEDTLPALQRNGMFERAAYRMSEGHLAEGNV
jgi:N-acyl-L-homoserine lactone synthetase